MEGLLYTLGMDADTAAQVEAHLAAADHFLSILWPIPDEEWLDITATDDRKVSA